MTTDIDKILETNRKPQKIVVLNIDSEIRSVCDPNYRRGERMQYEEYQRTGGSER